MKFKFHSMFILIFSAVLLSACNDDSNGSQSEGDASAENQSTVSIDLAHSIADSELTPHHAYAEIFKEIVEEKSNGEIEIVIHPNGVLGGERELIEGAEVGSIDAIISSASPLANFASLASVLEYPYLFDDVDHFFRVMDSEFGEELNESIERDGTLEMMGWFGIGFWGYGNSSSAITEPSDLNGLKLRAVENQVKQDWETQLGANPTPMAFTEVFTGLQQGVIDGLGNPVPLFVANNFQEVTGYVSETNHFFQQGLMVMSPQVFDSLTEEQQQWLEESAQEATDEHITWLEDVQELSFEAAMESGTEVIRYDELDHGAFREEGEKFKEKYGGEYVEHFDLIESLSE